MPYLYLAIAIITEVVATTALKASAEFTKLLPSLVVIIGYAISFYYMTLVLRTLPVGITYAVWSGVGIVLVAVFAALVYRQIPNMAEMIGMGLIILGVIVIHLFSPDLKQ